MSGLGCGAAEPKGARSISTAHTGFQMEAKNGNDCVEISAYVKDLQVVKIDLEPSSKASLITHGCSFVTPRPEISKMAGKPKEITRHIGATCNKGHDNSCNTLSLF